MNLYLKFDKNNWYDFGADDLSSVFPITKKKEEIMKQWINEALTTIARFSEPFGSF
ncbi:hypothetical protein EMA8858_01215 [Emticicia aquatica]|uniref:Uncharacterized protein n=1 Tax=Emticicia aquatica TaxID=1681835 RepID=A0ABM9AMR4_9BACT|nr:hypothetical protein [Emticicia aquatica]CAH0995095.1 hypothetical protein EMA8858_01215 [Emticicia aquatica]